MDQQQRQIIIFLAAIALIFIAPPPYSYWLSAIFMGLMAYFVLRDWVVPERWDVALPLRALFALTAVALFAAALFYLIQPAFGLPAFVVAIVLYIGGVIWHQRG